MRTIALVGTVGMVGMVGSGAEEDERAPSPRRSYDPVPEFDERKMTFECLKQFRNQKRLEGRLEGGRQASEKTRAEMD